MNMQEWAELLEQELLQAVEVKDRDSLHRYITLLSKNLVEQQVYQDNFTQLHNEIQSFSGTMEQGFHGMDDRFNAQDQKFFALQKQMNERFDAQQKLMDERFNAQDQKFSALQKQMDERFDVQQKLMDERFSAQDQKFFALQKQMDERFDAQQKQMDDRFNAQDQKFFALQKQMDERFDAQQKLMNARFDAQQKQMDERFTQHDKRFDALHRVSVLGFSGLALLITAFSLVLLLWR
ncbi:MAG: hypothetical protein U5P10_05080 [Spirochaetia bacterium]|nr:hypothetical protein [Spirochaetia bacterium]